MKEVIEKIVQEIDGTAAEKNGVTSVEALIAERKAFLSKKKLTYSFKVKIDEDEKVVNFSEMLKESGSGFTSGGFDGEMSMGVGFKKESYNTFSGAREGTIEESSKLFGKSFEYKFDYAKVRKEIEATAKEEGYKFEYSILPIK